MHLTNATELHYHLFMTISGDILNQLEIQGFRITKTRRFLVQIFQGNRLPLAESELRTEFLKLGMHVNKTTIYRELAQLQKLNLIKEIEFGDGKKRYELNSQSHHHHLICTNCRQVDEVFIEDGLKKVERRIGRQKKFKVAEHFLEFFGLCKDCLKNH